MALLLKVHQPKHLGQNHFKNLQLNALNDFLHKTFAKQFNDESNQFTKHLHQTLFFKRWL